MKEDTTSANNSQCLEEDLYKLFIQMRKKANIFNDFKYDEFDNCQNSTDFKKGFLIGARIAAIILKDS